MAAEQPKGSPAERAALLQGGRIGLVGTGSISQLSLSFLAINQVQKTGRLLAASPQLADVKKRQV